MHFGVQMDTMVDKTIDMYMAVENPARMGDGGWMNYEWRYTRRIEPRSAEHGQENNERARVSSDGPCMTEGGMSFGYSFLGSPPTICFRYRAPNATSANKIPVANLYLYLAGNGLHGLIIPPARPNVTACTIRPGAHHVT